MNLNDGGYPARDESIEVSTEQIKDRAIDLLSILCFLVEHSDCNFENGVKAPSGLDEGGCRAGNLLKEIKGFLCFVGDEYALDQGVKENELPF